MAKIDEKYHKLLQHILDEGYKYEDPNRKGIYRREISDYKIIHDFRDGFPALTTKELYWKGVVGELLWFLKGDTNIKYLVDNGINIWNKDAYNNYLSKKTSKKPYDFETFIQIIKNNENMRNISHFVDYTFGDLGRIYGAQWRNYRGNYRSYMDGQSRTMQSIDQISNLIKGLKENPMGTRHIVTAWNPAELDDMALPPCHWSFEILVEPLSLAERLDNVPSWSRDRSGDNDYPEHADKYNAPKYQFTLKWHQRSVDTFLGLPFNIASYSLLAYIIGKMTNMVPKSIIGDLSNVHIYEPHLEPVREQVNRDVNKYDKCELGINSEINNILSGKIRNKDIDLDTILNNIGIPDFNLKNYKSYPRIPAEMLAYSN